MKYRNRALASVGACAIGLVAAGSFGAPALAADTADLGIKLEGTTIAATSAGKFVGVSLLNVSKVDAHGILVTIDISKLNTKLVTFDENGCEAPVDGKILCGIEGDMIAAGEDVDWGFTLTRVPGAKGEDAGSITATISHEGSDPDPKNNEATATVTIGESGPDLTVVAGDVRESGVGNGGKVELTGELNPGEVAPLRYGVANFGDVATTGLKITVKLPEHVTFTEVEPDCVYGADNRSVVCTYNEAALVPADRDTNPDDKVYSAAGFYNLITVASDLDAPASLTGGTVTVEPIVAVSAVKALSANAVAELPKNALGQSAKDVDPSDNADDFTVFVHPADGTGGGGGGLPVTGVQAGLIGGVGLGVVLVGGALFFIARRRRVVLVTPNDVKPTA